MQHTTPTTLPILPESALRITPHEAIILSHVYGIPADQLTHATREAARLDWYAQQLELGISRPVFSWRATPTAPITPWYASTVKGGR